MDAALGIDATDEYLVGRTLAINFTSIHTTSIVNLVDAFTIDLYPGDI